MDFFRGGDSDSKHSSGSWKDTELSHVSREDHSTEFKWNSEKIKEVEETEDTSQNIATHPLPSIPSKPSQRIRVATWIVIIAIGLALVVALSYFLLR